jgi:tetratricopeptide (TPR) repeat protein
MASKSMIVVSIPSKSMIGQFMNILLRKSVNFVKNNKVPVLISALFLGIYKRESFKNLFYFSFHSIRANSFAKQGKVKEALQEFDEIIQRNPPSHFEKAEYLESLERFDEAIHEMDLMISKSTVDLIAAIAHEKKASYLIKKKEYISAMNVYQEMILKFPDMNQSDTMKKIDYLEYLVKSKHK